MQCPNCGAQLPDNSSFCTSCGAPVNQYQSNPDSFGQNTQNYGQQTQYGPNGQNPYYQQNPYGPNTQNPYQGPYGGGGAKMTRQEFDRHPAIKRCKSNITGSAITIYICAGVTFLINVLLTMNFFGMVDILLLVGLGLGIHLGKSRACAIILCIYGAINVLFILITTGRIGGWLILVAAIYAIIATFKYQSAWTMYQNTGMLPNT